MTAEICSAAQAARATGDADSAVASIAGTSRHATVEAVAKIVSGTSVVDEARAALIAAGWAVVVTGNRIAVDDEVLAQFVPARSGMYGFISARWIVCSVQGEHPTWIVGAPSTRNRLPGTELADTPWDV